MKGKTSGRMQGRDAWDWGLFAEKAPKSCGICRKRFRRGQQVVCPLVLGHWDKGGFQVGDLPSVVHLDCYARREADGDDY